MAIAAVVQLCSTANIPANLKLCRSAIDRAAKAGARLVCLPEASDYICPPGLGSKLLASPEHPQFLEGVREQARSSQVHVSVGVHVKSDDERAFNTQYLIGPDGALSEPYNKFDVDVKPDGPRILESNTTRPGASHVQPINTSIGSGALRAGYAAPAQWPAWAVGMTTCYDVRFPELYITLRRLGAQIVTCPSAFMVRTGHAHWEPLLRARAIETQCYVLAAAQIGTHYAAASEADSTTVTRGRESYGEALIVDPWGTVVARCPTVGHGDVPTIAYADIDLDYLAKVRREMPVMDQRRHDVYK